MSTKIERLTEEQEIELVRFRSEWLQHGLSVDPINRQDTERIIPDFYQRIGKTRPIFWYFDSPLSCQLIINLVFDPKKMVNLGANLWANLGDNLRANLGANLWANLWDNLRDNLWDNLRDNLGDNLRANLWANLWDNLRDNLWDNLKYHDATSWGQLDAPWIAFYEFGEKIGVKYQSEKSTLLRLWSDLAKSCFWWWAFDGLCFVSARPTRIMKNAAGRLHADGLMACEFKDGWGVYSNDGVRLPEKYGAVKTADWQAKWLLEETNAELRMCLIRAIGYDRICQELEAKKVDAWREYELIRIDNADVEPICLLKMTCPSTGKVHALRVEPTATDARKAITACNHGVDPESFIVEH